MRKRTKKGLSRMDAALDNMRPFGFSDANVRLVVRELLKVYGDDGWGFIEEGAYQVLLESLLQKAHEEDGEAEPENLLLEDGEIQECGNGNRNRKEEPTNMVLELEDGEIREYGNGNREEPELELEDGEIHEYGNGNRKEKPENVLSEDGEIQEYGNGNREEPKNLDLENGEIQEYGNGNREEPKTLELEDGEIQGSSHVGDECDKGLIVEKGCCNDISEEAGELQDELGNLYEGSINIGYRTLEEMPSLLKEDSPQVPVEASCHSFSPKTIRPMSSETRSRKREPCYGWIDDDDDDDSDDDDILSFVSLRENIS